jgi:hypothetical protein
LGVARSLAGALMDKFAPLFVDIDLPDAVILCDAPAPDVPKAAAMLHPNDADAIWYRGHASAMTLGSGGAIAHWAPENGLGIAARTAEPNDGHARLTPSGGVAYIREVNGGFVVDAALVEAEQFCCAIRLKSPEGQARTIITLNPSGGGNYLFLSEKDGMLEWRDDARSVEVTMPAPGPDIWVLAGYDHGTLSLTAAKTGTKFPAPQSSPDASAVLATALAGPSDLFIGCRSHRKGILKTLGSSVIHDVLFWLDTAGTTPDALDKITQACRFAEAQGDAS